MLSALKMWKKTGDYCWWAQLCLKWKNRSKAGTKGAAVATYIIPSWHLYGMLLTNWQLLHELISDSWNHSMVLLSIRDSLSSLLYLARSRKSRKSITSECEGIPRELLSLDLYMAPLVWCWKWKWWQHVALVAVDYSPFHLHHVS